MAEIPGIVWAAVGGFIGFVSLVMGFLRPAPNSGFFQLMMFVGIGMLIYGFVKIKLNQRTPHQRLEEHRQKTLQRGQREVEINIDDYKNNPQLRQQTLQQHEHSRTANPTHHGTPRTHQQPGHQNTGHSQTQATGQKFCTQCGTPLLKKHKSCPICGNRQ